MMKEMVLDLRLGALEVLCITLLGSIYVMCRYVPNVIQDFNLSAG